MLIAYWHKIENYVVQKNSFTEVNFRYTDNSKHNFFWKINFKD